MFFLLRRVRIGWGLRIIPFVLISNHIEAQLLHNKPYEKNFVLSIYMRHISFLL